ncbi:hypothetical protein [Aeromicrobium chenweiae]|uniref:Uncharacterized protein n=1 Tax=Aeromicrobium chenweiae TaxID=2079793 RepID=A0A2S0WPQ9_9ACTN|nr:hypothetical protein [Aeromicrobium chenweiae]AWB93306.1 hypothetical protein C3E78_14415 [Aeromicrobium chenweiae]TGN34298.1 hypothetical protein E4L97_04445 [Aeromicrobium chenweiae]
MNRHPFRWEGLAFGLFFLAIVGNWAVWERDLLSTRELSLTASGVLILLGVIGIAATLRPTRPSQPTPHPVPEGDHDEEADPQH